MENIFNKDIKLNDHLQLKEYRFMYNFGSWTTKKRFCAENDAEAIFDADEIYRESKTMQNWKYRVALFCGNRLVKDYEPHKRITF